jgi:drug/metabolite transporter (DMT)-like permease
LNLSRHKIGIAVMLLCTVLWSMAGPVTRATSISNGWETSFWRSMFLSIIVAALLLVQHRAQAVHKILAMGWPGVVSSLCWTAMFTCFMLALSHTSVANALVIMGLLPFFAAISGWIFLQEKVALRTWIAMAAAAAGIGIMFHEGLGSASLVGSLYALVVPVAAAVNTIAVKRGRGKVDLVPALLVGGVIAVLISLPFASPYTATGRDLALLGGMAMFQLALPCVLLVSFVIPRLSAAEIGLLSLLEVVLGPLWVWTFFGEHPGAAVLTGGFVVLAALAANEGIALATEKRS